MTLFSILEIDTDIVNSDSEVDELDESVLFFEDTSNEEDETLNQDENVSTKPRKPLYNGAPSEEMACLLLFQYSVRHSLTGKAFQELIQLITVFLPADALLPKSIRHLKQHFLKNSSEQCPVMQYYCDNCHRLLKNEEECDCNAHRSQFVTVPVGPQLKARLESRYSKHV